MTCIIGFTNGKTVWMGGDSMAMDSWHNKSVIAQPKVFINKGFLIGYSTSFRMGQLLQYVFVPPECKTKDIYKYMVTKFVDAWRKCMQDKGWLHTSNQGKENGREGKKDV